MRSWRPLMTGWIALAMAALLALPLAAQAEEPAPPPATAAPEQGAGEPPPPAQEPAAEAPAEGQAEGETAAPEAPAGEEPAEPAPPGEVKVSMDFRGVGIDAVLEMFSRVTNLTILKDPTVEGTVTIISPEEITLDEAFKMLRSVLEVRGYAMVRDKQILKIVPMERAVQMTQTTWLPGIDQDRPPGEVVTELLPLQHADAVQIQNEFKSLISKGASLIGNAATNSLILTDTAANVERLVRLIQQLDIETASSLKTHVFTLKYADAAEVADLLNQLFGSSGRSSSSRSSSSGRGSSGGGPSSGFRPPGFSPFGGFRGFGDRGGGPGRSSAPGGENNSRQQTAVDGGDGAVRLASLTSTQPVATRIASEAPLLSAVDDPVLLAESRGPGDFFRRFFERRETETPQSAAAALGETRIVADPYTNSIIVIAPDDRLAAIEEVLTEVDRQVENDTSVRVFKLRYAEAAELATVVSQAFQPASTSSSSRSSRSSLPYEQRLRGYSSRSGSSASLSLVQATPDTRTNSLVVNAPVDYLKEVEALITELDQPTETISTTFSIAVENARASEVAARLNELLGLSSISGTQTSARTSTATNARRPTSGSGAGGSRPSLSTSGSSFGGRSATRAAPSGQGGTLGAAALSGEPPIEEVGSPVGRGARDANVQLAQYRGSTTRDPNATVLDANGQVVSVTTLDTAARIVGDDETNTLLIDALPQTAETIRQLVKQLDVAPAQVMVDVTIAEVSLDDETKLGIEWSWVDKATAGSTAMTATTSTDFGLAAETSGFKYSVIADNGTFSALLHAMATDQRVSILSKPKVFTRNNEPAQINISQSVPYLRGTTITGTGVTQNNYEYIDVGIVLDVTPHITHGEQVTLDVLQTANEIIGFTSFEAPIIATRSADTSVTLRDGQTVVLGGIMKESITKRLSKIPLLGDIPVLGKLFQSRDDLSAKTELMLFLRPRIVRTTADLEAVTAEARAANGTAKLIEKHEPAAE